MKKLRDDSGITMVTLAVTIIVMMILTISLTASTSTSIEMKRYNEIKEDIIALTEEVKLYYMKNNEAPIHKNKSFDLNALGIPAKDINPNDIGKYYPINTTILSKDLELNKGEGNKNSDFGTKDLYIINENSLTVYYLNGAVLNGQKHYTIIDDASGGSFASEYYSKVDLPIISVVTMESNGKDKEKATINDTVTLKMLANYTLTRTPTITIAGNIVQTTWNGKIGTATYTFPPILTEEEKSKVGSRIEFRIENYEADGRIGQAITDVTFGNGVVLYEKERPLKIGDYVNYTYDEVNTGYSLTSGVSGHTADQTISQPVVPLKWRILNINDDKSVDLISEKPTDTTVTFSGALGYNNGVYALNDMCEKLFSNSSKGIKARSINVGDIEKQETPEGTKGRKDYVWTDNNVFSKQYGKTHTYTTNLQYPLLYAKGLGSGVDEVEPKQPENLEVPDPFKESSVGYTNPPTTEMLGTAKSVLMATQTYYVNRFTAEKYGKAADLIASSNWYWVASRCVRCYSEHTLYCLRDAMEHLGSSDLYNSMAGSWASASRIRPIVTIKNNVKIDSADLSKDGSTPDLAYEIVEK